MPRRERAHLVMRSCYNTCVCARTHTHTHTHTHTLNTAVCKNIDCQAKQTPTHVLTNLSFSPTALLRLFNAFPRRARRPFFERAALCMVNLKTSSRVETAARQVAKQGAKAAEWDDCSGPGCRCGS